MNKILLIIPITKDLDKIILEGFKKKYQVIFIRDRFFNITILKALTRIFPYYSKIFYFIYVFIKLIFIKKIDNLVVINGEDLSSLLIKFLDKKYKFKRKILYAWDSIKQKKHLLKLKDNFDRCFSNQFEKNKSFHQLDLFYVKTRKNEPSRYDYCFIGTIYSGREKQINTIINQTKIKKIFLYFYFQSIWFYFLKKITLRTNVPFELAKFKVLNFAEMSKKLRESECIIDINHKNNPGITQRGIQSIYYGKKILSNNLNYSKYISNFYYLDKLKIRKVEGKKTKILSIDEWIKKIMHS